MPYSFIDVEKNGRPTVINLELVSHAVLNTDNGQLYIHFMGQRDEFILAGSEAKRVWEIISPKEQRKKPVI